MRLIKYEFVRLLYSRIVWAIMASILLMGFFLSFLTMKNIRMISDEMMVSLAFSNPVLSMWSGVLLAPAFFGFDFYIRGINIPIYNGNSRTRILLVRIFFYYLFGSIIMLCTILTTFYIGNRMVLVLNSNVLEKLAFILFINCATLTMPMVFTFIFQDLLTGIGTSALLTYLLQRLMENSEYYTFLNFYPPNIQIKLAYNSVQPMFFLVCILYIIFGFFVCHLILLRRELK